MFCLRKFSSEIESFETTLHMSIFSPSTSRDEKFSKKIYAAEEHGNSGNCDSIYGEKCPFSIFDLITKI